MSIHRGEDEMDIVHWAMQEIIVDTLSNNAGFGGSASDVGSKTMKPVLLVQERLGALGPRTPVEIFTDEDPPMVAKLARDRSVENLSLGGEDLWPNARGFWDFEEYLGVYLPREETIKIFTKKIARCAKTLNLDSRELESVVRFHELGHTVVHLGTNTAAADWQVFLDTRLKFWDAIQEDLHEFLAQLIAWNCLDDSSVRQTFRALMNQQSEHYQLNDEELELPMTEVDPKNWAP